MYNTNQQSGLSKGSIGLIVAVLLVLVAGIGACAKRNSFVRLENDIAATQQDMQNVHGSVYSQIKGQGLAVEKYGDMVIEALNVAMTKRYGEGGSKAAFQWIQEHNPSISPEIMTKLQQVIESGYNRFEAVQRAKIDKVRVYKNELDVFPGSLVAVAFGFPRIDMNEAEQVISSAQTKKDFAKKELSPPDPFSKKRE